MGGGTEIGWKRGLTRRVEGRGRAGEGCTSEEAAAEKSATVGASKHMTKSAAKTSGNMIGESEKQRRARVASAAWTMRLRDEWFDRQRESTEGHVETELHCLHRNEGR